MAKIPLLLQFDDESRQTAEIYVDGRIHNEPCRFLLDTGCAKTTLMRNRFTQELPTIGQQESSGTFGRAVYDLVELASLSIGPILRENWLVKRAPKGGTDRHLLGMDVMRDYCLHFSFEQGEVSVLPGSDPRNGLVGHELVMERWLIPYITAEVGGLTGRVLWDSGASITLVSSELVRRHPEMFVSLGSEIGTDSTNAQMNTPIFMMDGLTVAHRKFRPLKVAAVEFSKSHPRVEDQLDIVLGYSALRQADWLFDFSNCKWAITKMLI